MSSWRHWWRDRRRRQRGADRDRSSGASIVFVGVLPGPKNGMTLLTQFLLDDLVAHGSANSVTVIDVGKGYRGLGRGWQIRRSLGALRSAMRLSVHRSDSAVTSVYVVGNSDSGLPLSALQVAVARVRRFAIVYHHHTTASIDDPRMRLVVACCGPDAVHVVSGSALRDRLLHRFPGVTTLELPPSVRALNSPDRRAAPSPTGAAERCLTIGHVSNLTRDKGVLTVIRTVRHLMDSGVSCRGLIVGPFGDEQLETEARIEAAGLDIAFTGQLLDDELLATTRQFDVFLFPSTYRHESWAMVIDEVLALGVPVITTAFPGAERIRSGGVVLADGEPDPRQIAMLIEQWHDRPGGLDELRNAALEAAAQLRTDGDRQLERFRQSLCAAPSPEDTSRG